MNLTQTGLEAYMLGGALSTDFFGFLACGILHAQFIMVEQQRGESVTKQTNGSLRIGVKPEFVSLGDAGISTSIYNVLLEYYSDEFVSICCDDPGPKCSAEIHIGEDDGLVSIDYIARCEEGTVKVEWFSDDGVGPQVVDNHVRTVIEEAHYTDYHPPAH